MITQERAFHFWTKWCYCRIIIHIKSVGWFLNSEYKRQTRYSAFSIAYILRTLTHTVEIIEQIYISSIISSGTSGHLSIDRHILLRGNSVTETDSKAYSNCCYAMTVVYLKQKTYFGRLWVYASTCYSAPYGWGLLLKHFHCIQLLSSTQNRKKKMCTIIYHKNIIEQRDTVSGQKMADTEGQDEWEEK